MTEVTPTFPKAQHPTKPSAARAILALMLRDMASAHGRSILGYLWAILEPAGGILLMTFIFVLVFRAPPIGTNYPLFFASGLLPFSAYMALQQKTSVALRNSKPLLFYPGVTFLDALLAKLIMEVLTQVLVFFVVFTTIITVYDLDLYFSVVPLVGAFSIAVFLGFAVGTLNCYLQTVFPAWERIWGILNRPLFIVSGVLFIFDSIPLPYRDWVWWNPLIQIVGLFRSGIYATYDASYVNVMYPLLLGGGILLLGIILLARYHRDLMNL